jgi:polar amino acid transport system substrate-binding protein
MKALAKGGALRVAINTGNRALVQMEGEQPVGVSPALARRLADQLGVAMEPVIYDGAGKVFADAGHDIWDVGFLAIDTMRAKGISFTRPYHVIEATYAVRVGSSVANVEEADRVGRVVLTSTGSAYDMYLQANLRHAMLEHSGTPSESFAEFRTGRGDVVAGVRASLERFFAGDDSVRILPDVLTKVEQAMALPGADNTMITALDMFLAQAIDDGFVEAALNPKPAVQP